MSAGINNIKSNFILEKIFSILSENTKLKVVFYNINIQKKIGVNINTYKNIFFENKEDLGNGIIREYKKGVGTKIYEGEFFKGKWHGNGKEYNELGELIYEGRFLFGKRNGIGKEYLSKSVITKANLDLKSKINYYMMVNFQIIKEMEYVKNII